MFCPKCGARNDDHAAFCSSCGNSLTNINRNEDLISCPNCGSTQVEFVTYQSSSNFDAGDACCGYMLCGPLGLLFGAKPKTEARTVRKCKNCGHEF